MGNRVPAELNVGTTVNNHSTKSPFSKLYLHSTERRICIFQPIESILWYFRDDTFSLLYSEGHSRECDPPPGSGTSPPSNLLYDQATTVNPHRRRENNTSLILKLLFAMVGCWEGCSSRSWSVFVDGFSVGCVRRGISLRSPSSLKVWI